MVELVEQDDPSASGDRLAVNRALPGNECRNLMGIDNARVATAARSNVTRFGKASGPTSSPASACGSARAPSSAVVSETQFPSLGATLSGLLSSLPVTFLQLTAGLVGVAYELRPFKALAPSAAAGT